MRQVYAIERGDHDDYEVVAVFERLEDAQASLDEGLGDSIIPIDYVRAGEQRPRVVTIWHAREWPAGHMEIGFQRMPAKSADETLHESPAGLITYASGGDRQAVEESVIRRGFRRTAPRRRDDLAPPDGASGQEVCD